MLQTRNAITLKTEEENQMEEEHFIRELKLYEYPNWVLRKVKFEMELQELESSKKN